MSKPQDSQPSLPVEATEADASLEATGRMQPAESIDAALFHRLDYVFANRKIDEAIAIVAGFADPNIHTDMGWNAMHIAASHGAKDAINPLLKLGTSIENRTDFGHSPLHQAVIGNHVSFVSVLLESGANPNVRDNAGRTPIFPALRCRNSEKDYDSMKRIRAALLEYGADTNIADDSGVRPLDMAIDYATDDEIVWLLNNGANPNVEIDGKSHLHRIAEWGLLSAETVKILVKYGASLEATDRNGLRPVDYAERSGRKDLVEILSPSN